MTMGRSRCVPMIAWCPGVWLQQEDLVRFFFGRGGGLVHDTAAAPAGGATSPQEIANASGRRQTCGILPSTNEISRAHWERNSPRCMPVCPGGQNEARQGPTPGRERGRRGARGAATEHQGRDGGGGASASAEAVAPVLAKLERQHRRCAASADRRATPAGTPSHIVSASAKGSLEGDQHRDGQPPVWGCVTRGGCWAGQGGRAEGTERGRSSRLRALPSRGKRLIGPDVRLASTHPPLRPRWVRGDPICGGGMAFAFGCVPWMLPGVSAGVLSIVQATQLSGTGVGVCLCAKV